MRVAVALTVLTLTTGLFAQDPWTDLGGGLAGTSGIPQLSATGTLQDTDPIEITLTGARPSSAAVLFVSTNLGPVPFKGGSLFPAPQLSEIILTTDELGAVDLMGSWRPDIPSNLSFYLQFGVEDPGAIKGVELSNAMQGTTPDSSCVTFSSPVAIVGWWQGEDNTDDSSGNGHMGTWLDANPHYDDGIVGRCFKFTGTPLNIVQVHQGTLGDFPIGHESRSLELWIKLPSTSADDLADIAFGYSGGTPGQPFTCPGNAGFFLFPQSEAPATTLGNSAFTSSGADLYASPATDFADDTWHHLAVTFDEASRVVKLYVDGTFSNSGSFTLLETELSGGAFIGGHDYPAPVATVIDGLVDEVTLYAGVLSADDIANIYAKGQLGVGKCR